MMQNEINYFKKNTGFTLAEVLITLGIIGVVASITIPTLMNNIQDQQYKTAYKKAYAALSQALLNANQEDLLIDAQITAPRPTDFDKNFLALMSKFKVTKQCTSQSNNQDCWEPTGEKYGLNFSSGYPTSFNLAFVDSSGMVWSQYIYQGSQIFVDTNGFKKPNRWGKDRFAFFIRTATNSDTGLPVKVIPYPDNFANICTSNACATSNDYFGTSWLYK